MNRPRWNDKKYHDSDSILNDYTKFVRDLVQYCDNLEEKLSKGDCITHYETKIQELEAALDKAIDRISDLTDCQDCPFAEGKCYDGEYHMCFRDKEWHDYWKEWCMNNE